MGDSETNGQALAALRRDYSRARLRKEDLAPDPVDQFKKWFQQALETEVVDANAMTLATAGKGGVPSARIVLLKAVDERGFAFFTNYESDKARDLAENPRACLVFFWPELERQVRVTGSASKLPQAESQGYFDSRPRGSRLAAWVSRQSAVIPGREALEAGLEELEKRFPGEAIPCPPNWGGYVVAPERVEFWQGRPSRLHDRLCYVRQEDGRWLIERLAP